MTEEELYALIEKVANEQGLPPDEVREAMEFAAHDAWLRARNHPATRELWDLCPREGEEPTLLEFLPYLILLTSIERAQHENLDLLFPNDSQSPLS